VGGAAPPSTPPQPPQPQNTTLPPKVMHVSQAEQPQPSQSPHEGALAAAGDNVPLLYYGGAALVVLGGIGAAVYVWRRRHIKRY